MELRKVDGTLCNNPQEIADLLNENFATMGTRTVTTKYGPHRDDYNYIIDSHNSSVYGPQPKNFVFREIVPYDIVEQANQIKANMGGCLHSVPGKIYKQHIHVLSDVIAALYNQCLIQGICPNELKFGVITPLLKKGSPLEANNYRPISSVPYLAKLFESILNQQISDYLKQLIFTHPQQYGFRSNSNTSLALMQLQKYITESWEGGYIVAAFFLDVEKAFDSVDKRILLSILKQIHFSEGPLTFSKVTLRTGFKSPKMATTNRHQHHPC